MPTITPGASLPLKGNGATVTVSTPLLDLTQTWNAGGVAFTGLRANITDTASAAGSLLLDLQVGGTSKLSVSKSGVVVSASSIQSGGTVASSAGGGASIGADGSGKPQVVFGSGGSVLNYEAANTLALRNGASGQTFNIYNSFTDAANYELGQMSWVGNALRIGTSKAGTGGSRVMDFYVGGTPYWRVDTSGNFVSLAAASVLSYKQGANGSCGTFVANGASAVTVSNTSVAITDTIHFSLNTVGGTVGAYPTIKTITAATGFTVTATAADTSTYNYVIIKNAP